jgi:hypothetical protein
MGMILRSWDRKQIEKGQMDEAEGGGGEDHQWEQNLKLAFCYCVQFFPVPANAAELILLFSNLAKT